MQSLKTEVFTIKRKSEIIQEAVVRPAKSVRVFKTGEAENPWDGRGAKDLLQGENCSTLGLMLNSCS